MMSQVVTLSQPQQQAVKAVTTNPAGLSQRACARLSRLLFARYHAGRSQLRIVSHANAWKLKPPRWQRNMGATMKITDNVTIADGKAARDRLIAKARQQAASGTVRDIAKPYRQWRPRPKPYTFEDMLPDTTQDD